MHLVCSTLWLPKKGNTAEEYEDAAAPLDPIDKDTDVFRCAVADGATETSFSRTWAKLLVEGYVERTARATLKERWADSISGKQLAWYAEEKAQSGAFAALVGLQINDCADGGTRTWVCEALGDSCLILVRGKSFVEQFPLTHSDEFNSSPILISSSSPDGEAEEELIAKSGEWQPGDIFYLLSDAIARWTYKRQEDYGDASVWLKSMTHGADFDAFVELQRELTDAEMRPLMRNDDVTLMRVELT